MSDGKSDILIGQTPINEKTQSTTGSFVQFLGETYYRISHYDQMPPFFMSLLSSADHWLFIASTDGLTAGRMNAKSALFPYETEDKITAHSELTGSKTITQLIRLLHQDQVTLEQQIEVDIAQGTADLVRYVAAADGLQLSTEETTTTHHFANVLFNIMRGASLQMVITWSGMICWILYRFVTAPS